MAIKTLKSKFPWWAKIGLKIALSRLPIQHDFWKSLNVFEHGFMEQPKYAYHVFKKHFEQASQVKSLEPGFLSLELGPGESLQSVLIANSFGSSKAYIVDVARFASEDLPSYQEMANFLQARNLNIADFDDAQSVDEIIDRCGGCYLTSGISSLRSIEENSVDFIWSHAVLEHVKDNEFLETIKELRRIVKDDGVCSHTVDLKDHLNLSLNNLRFSNKVWESDWMANSGFYTNRIRYSQMLSMFEAAGFKTETTELEKWDTLPLERSKLARQFRDLTEEDLCVSGFSVVLTPDFAH